MRLPHGDRAIIDERKVVDYCLSDDHDDGRHKARLFRNILGITRDHSERLLNRLKEAAATGNAKPGKLDNYGRRYVIDFELEGQGGAATVRSAWIVLVGEEVPRLVTCYIL